MAKNTNTSGFRKIDIDSYDPENYRDDDDQVGNVTEDGSGPNESEIINYLNSYVIFIFGYCGDIEK